MLCLVLSQVATLIRRLRRHLPPIYGGRTNLRSTPRALTGGHANYKVQLFFTPAGEGLPKVNARGKVLFIIYYLFFLLSSLFFNGTGFDLKE